MLVRQVFVVVLLNLELFLGAWTPEVSRTFYASEASLSWTIIDMPFCTECGVKSSRDNRLKDSICNTCRSKKNAEDPQTGHESGEEYDISDDTPLSEIRFGDLKKYFKSELRTEIRDIVKEELAAQLGSTKKDVTQLKTEVNKNKQSLASCSTNISNLQEDVKKIQEERKEENAISKNNLKYLINLDRNERRNNLLLFGLPEDDDLNIDGEISTSEMEKFIAVLKKMEIYDQCKTEIRELFRLGKKDNQSDDKIRPLKVRMLTSTSVTTILGAARKLKDLEDYKIYVKPDKTKGEREEFTRLGKKKEQLLQEYDNDAERVKLEKGVLYVDNVEVDRYKSVQSLF